MPENVTSEEKMLFRPGDMVKARGREWVVLPETRENTLKLRPLGGAEDDTSLIYLPVEPEEPVPATFGLPDPEKPGSQEAAVILKDALLLKLRAGAGPFRSLGNINFEPRAYQLVPLLMALKLDTIRLLIADDVGIGKTIEAGLIARELIDRGEIEKLAVICPPHLCEQWKKELAEKFNIEAEIVRTGTATRLERDLRPDESVFEVYPYTVVSLDYIKSDRRRDDFLRTCPNFVIVDEAHTCVRANTSTRHQRYRLLSGLAQSEPRRNMLFLTATPHSGDDEAFYNLLGLLEPKFSRLGEMPDENDEQRRGLRTELSDHFVQRRRGDIDEWKDSFGFPIRESREATYSLSGEWGNLFDDVLDYARSMVRRTEGGTKLQQRMSWWAALALLRCISSSPAAASIALRTRLKNVEGDLEESQQIAHLDESVKETVMDEADYDSLTLDETVPAGTVEDPEDTEKLRNLIERADSLRGLRKDAKLKTLVKEISQLISSGFKPVVFCRYIATADYVGEELRRTLKKDEAHVIVVTGELTSDQREEKVEEFGEINDKLTPVLVATDCLSEGINLQRYFDAVIHYDLNWNPTRHEQREGRADRFGQSSRTVRALMLYGENNPVDGAVLRVILRKAEKIRKELGVSVPLPRDNNKVIETIMNAVLLRQDGTHARQISLNLEYAETEVDNAWETTKNKMSRTVFAQQRLRPGDVIPEWNKTVSVLGGQDDVIRFVRACSERLNAPLNRHNGYSRIPVDHLPPALQQRLDDIGFRPGTKISFTHPSPTGAVHIHRTHPVVNIFADYVVEDALEKNRPDIGSRSGAVFTKDVKTRTVLYLLRLRNQIQVEKRNGNGSFMLQKYLLAEECLAVAIPGSDISEILIGNDALALLSLEPGRNMQDGQKTLLVKKALDKLTSLESTFADIARARAKNLLDDHRRIREASDAKGIRYEVTPASVDKIGVYVFMPMTST